MYKILVPVDFYKSSFTAFYYAAQFCQQFEDAEITLFHVVDGSFNMSDDVVLHSMKLAQEEALKKLIHFQLEYARSQDIILPDVKIKRRVRFGLPAYAIVEYASQNDIDLIVMGTRDRHNLYEKLLGSVSAVTLQNSECPIMLIHTNAIYNSTKKIVFAFDEVSNLKGALKEYTRFNSSINAKTEFVHVNMKNEDNVEHQLTQIVSEMFEKPESTTRFEVKSIDGDNIQDSIRDYCIFTKADILVMVHRKRGIVYDLFRTKHSVKMAQEFHLPILIFQENE